MYSNAAHEGAATLVHSCGRVEQSEKALVIANPATQDVAELVAQTAREAGAHVDMVVEEAAAMHGAEPSAETAAKMAASDVIFCLTLKSLAHSSARKAASDAGARYLSLADYSMDQLESPALNFDFASLTDTVERLGAVLDEGEDVRMTTPLGSDVTFSIKGRAGNRAPGYVAKGGDLSSPPDAEVNVAPVETTATGVVYVDGSIPCDEIGLLDAPVRLTLKDGAIVGMDGNEAAVAALEKLFTEAGPKSRVLGEFGIGLNPMAELCGRMLEDEGCAGTMHFGFGSNSTIGGRNVVNFHLDFIIKDPTVYIDGAEIEI